MKILIYNWKDVKNPNVGGAELITFEMARRLTQDGHQVSWFCRAFSGCKTMETIDGVKVIRQGGLLSTYLKGRQYYKSLAQKPALVIDMVNTLAWQTPLYAKESKITAYVNQLAREVFFYEMTPLLGWVPFLLENLEYQTYRSVPVLCYSQSTEDDLVSVGLKRSLIKRFNMGLDHKKYIQGRKSATPLFICVSRLAKMKRVDLSIRAFALILKKHPRARLAIFGSGPDAPRLKKIVTTLRLENKIYFTMDNHPVFSAGSGDPKVEFMQKSWALLTPSVKEGWCMTVTEANACGTPAIGARVSGLQDSIRHNQTGILLKKNPCPEEMAQVMEKLITDKSWREKLSQNAINWAQNFSWDNCYQSFKKALAEVSNLSL